jgi:predicted RNase H-related nuclease YkuK (DUF458 family)
MAASCLFTMKKQGNIIILKKRMLVEVAKSIEVAYELCNLFIEYDVIWKYNADINTNPAF